MRGDTGAEMGETSPRPEFEASEDAAIQRAEQERLQMEAERYEVRMQAKYEYAKGHRPVFFKLVRFMWWIGFVQGRVKRMFYR